ISTPPIPQTTVSQRGMLSRLPGAKNLPSSPMMMPAMITPMMSTGDPFHCWDGLVPRRSRVPVRPRLNPAREALHDGGSRSHGELRTPSALVHLHRMRSVKPARGQDRGGPGGDRSDLNYGSTS